MKKTAEHFTLSASDLVGHLQCEHLTQLDIKVAEGGLAKPSHYDPLLEILRERGRRHEASYIEHLEQAGHEARIIQGIDVTDEAVSETLDAMRNGNEIIVQAALSDGNWHGRADILRRVPVPSQLGEYSYEIIDTKLARETKGGTVLQLCLYADLLERMQGVAPEHIYVVTPWSDYEPQHFRFADFAAYYRRVRLATENAVAPQANVETYPEPRSHCDICRWQASCEIRRREDDHLCLVAGISKGQIAELRSNQIETTKALAELSSPLPFKPERGSLTALEKVRAQAAIQVEGRESGKNKFQLLDIVPKFGLAALPEPNEGDIYFDIEGDEFVGEHGLEYLFGYSFRNTDGNMEYIADWAFTRADEKAIFERFMDFVAARRQQHPGLHVYHFGSYETSTLKRLMGRYATKETEVDNLLRGLVMVDLLRITKHALIASVESYSLKKLEAFFQYERETPLHDANVALTKLSSCLELDDVGSIDEKTKAVVQNYNRDDCVSTSHLHDWLESLRSETAESGIEIPRPEPGQDAPSEEISEHEKRVLELVQLLTADVPVDESERTPEQHARWILAHTIDWHRRENKATWWEYFRLKAMNADELLDEKAAIGHLEFLGTVDSTATGIPIDRYRFAEQDTDIRGGEELEIDSGGKLGEAVQVSPDALTIDIKKKKATADIHPKAIFAHKVFKGVEQSKSLFRLAEYVTENGIEGAGDLEAARDLLLRKPLDMEGEPFRKPGEQSLEAALRLTGRMNGGVLPIQGPPGTGKSFTGARMICELVKRGKSVGITANSHKVIRNLLDKVIEAAPECGCDLKCIQKPESGNKEEPTDALCFAKRNEDLIEAISSGSSQIAGATHFFWSREDAKALVDVLFVDEAGQMSLANVLAVAQAGQTLVLLGDPQQLDQPTQGSHPDGTGVSALDHLLDGAETITDEQGLFLGETYRLHPDICALNSELFYEGKLAAVEDNENQTVTSEGLINGCGLRYVPVHHVGNTSSSAEEADRIKEIVEDILGSESQWTTRSGEKKEITLEDILIIAPYNAQVFEIRQRLPEARVGTVDKFQGQEAPIAIFSMTTSSYSDAPRGMEFLYSANRFNVAISRARCVAVLVASPAIFEAECKTPEQMRLANAFCRFHEIAKVLN